MDCVIDSAYQRYGIDHNDHSMTNTEGVTPIESYLINKYGIVSTTAMPTPNLNIHSDYFRMGKIDDLELNENENEDRKYDHI